MAKAKSDTYQLVRTLQIARATLLLLAAVALIAFLRDIRIPVNGLYMTRDALTSQAQTVFVPGIRNLLDAPIAYMLAIGLAFSALIALYRFTKGEPDYKKQVKKTSDSLKWIDLAISSAIMIEVVALLSGVSDLSVIKIGAGLIVATCGLGWLADRQNLGAKTPEYSAYGISVLSGILPWLAIGQALLFTSLYGGVRLPWYSYALAGTVFVGFSLIALNQLMNIRRRRAWVKYPSVERNYLVLDTILKTVATAILIVGLKG